MAFGNVVKGTLGQYAGNPREQWAIPAFTGRITYPQSTMPELADDTHAGEALEADESSNDTRVLVFQQSGDDGQQYDYSFVNSNEASGLERIFEWHPAGIGGNIILNWGDWHKQAVRTKLGGSVGSVPAHTSDSNIVTSLAIMKDVMDDLLVQATLGGQSNGYDWVATYKASPYNNDDKVGWMGNLPLIGFTSISRTATILSGGLYEFDLTFTITNPSGVSNLLVNGISTGQAGWSAPDLQHNRVARWFFELDQTYDIAPLGVLNKTIRIRGGNN